MASSTTRLQAFFRSGQPTSPCAEDNHSVSIKMHNIFVKNIFSIERISLKAISMARLISRLHLCILIACYSPDIWSSRMVLWFRV